MHKYNIVFTEWFENSNTLYKKINIYVENNFDAECYYYVYKTIRYHYRYATIKAISFPVTENDTKNNK